MSNNLIDRHVSELRQIAAQAINQGRIYNEGAVHGTAQRVSALRLSSAVAALYLKDLDTLNAADPNLNPQPKTLYVRDLDRGTEEAAGGHVDAGYAGYAGAVGVRGSGANVGSVASAVARWRAEEGMGVRGLLVSRTAGAAGLRIVIHEPRTNQRVGMSLVHGVYVSFRLVLGPGEGEGGGGEGGGIGCGNVVKVVVVVDGRVVHVAEVRTCELRRVQVEGLKPRKHSLHLKP